MKRQQNHFRNLFFFLLLASLPGCASYRVCTPCVVKKHGHPTKDPLALELKAAAADHFWYHLVPRHRCQIRWYDLGHWVTWALLGNDDDGAFGEEPSACYKPEGSIGLKRALSWNARNPLHNFCFYVIGTAYSDTSEFTLIQLASKKSTAFQYDPCAKTVFAGEGSSFYLGFHSWLPFISLRLDYGRRLELYAGWRERGNFGLKFTPARRYPNTHSTALDKT